MIKERTRNVLEKRKEQDPFLYEFLVLSLSLSLKALATKISQTIKEDKTYSNIPFGKSLIDVLLSEYDEG